MRETYRKYLKKTQKNHPPVNTIPSFPLPSSYAHTIPHPFDSLLHQSTTTNFTSFPLHICDFYVGLLFLRLLKKLCPQLFYVMSVLFRLSCIFDLLPLLDFYRSLHYVSFYHFIFLQCTCYFYSIVLEFNSALSSKLFNHLEKSRN